MYEVKCGVPFNKGIQIVFDSIEDFNRFDDKRKEKNESGHPIRGYVKEVNCEVIYHDEYNTGIYEWSVVG